MSTYTARGIHQDVQPPLARDDPAHRFAGGLAVRHVKYVCGQPLRLRESANASRIEICDVHARAAVRQPLGNRLANALCGARYERDASIVADVHVSISS